MGIVLEQPFICLVTEFCPHGALSDFLTQNDKKHLLSSWVRRCEIALGTARGLHFLHTRTPQIIHRDVKPDNVLLDGSWNAKVCDFGLTTLCDRANKSGDMRALNSSNPAMTTSVGTCGYQAPELFKLDDDGRFLDRSKYTTAIDVYAFGMVLYEVAIISRAWLDITAKQGPFFLEIADRVSAGDRPSWGDCSALPPGWRDLVEQCWSQEADDRPSMSKVALGLERVIQDGLPLSDRLEAANANGDTIKDERRSTTLY